MMDDNEALEMAKQEQEKIMYLLETGMLNRGLYQIYARRYDWLSRIIILAELQMEGSVNNVQGH